MLVTQHYLPIFSKTIISAGVGSLVSMHSNTLAIAACVISFLLLTIVPNHIKSHQN